MVGKQAAINAVKRFAEAIRAQGVDLKTAILFGSYARGEQQEWSDIDVALVADEFVQGKRIKIRLTSARSHVCRRNAFTPIGRPRRGRIFVAFAQKRYKRATSAEVSHLVLVELSTNIRPRRGRYDFNAFALTSLSESVLKTSNVLLMLLSIIESHTFNTGEFEQGSPFRACLDFPHRVKKGSFYVLFPLFSVM